MAVQGSSGLDLLLLFILLSSGAEWRPSCFDGFQLLAASLGLLWKGRHAVLVGFLLLKGRQSLVSPPLLQCPNCPVLKRFRVTGCSLTDCLDENHASCIHFSGLEFYLASQQTECELWLVRMMAGLQPAKTGGKCTHPLRVQSYELQMRGVFAAENDKAWEEVVHGCYKTFYDETNIYFIIWPKLKILLCFRLLLDHDAWWMPVMPCLAFPIIYTGRIALFSDFFFWLIFLFR